MVEQVVKSEKEKQEELKREAVEVMGRFSKQGVDVFSEEEIGVGKSGNLVLETGRGINNEGAVNGLLELFEGLEDIKSSFVNKRIMVKHKGLFLSIGKIRRGKNERVVKSGEHLKDLWDNVIQDDVRRNDFDEEIKERNGGKTVIVKPKLGAGRGEAFVNFVSMFDVNREKGRGTQADELTSKEIIIRHSYLSLSVKRISEKKNKKKF